MGSFADSAPAPKGVETQKPASKQAPFSQCKSAQYDANVGIYSTQNAGLETVAPALKYGHFWNQFVKFLEGTSF